MKTTKRTERLRKLMTNHKLKAKDVGLLLNRSPGTVRIWRCQTGEGGREIPEQSLELLEIKLKQGAK